MSSRIIATTISILALAALAGAVAAGPHAEQAILRFVVAGGGGRSEGASHIVQGTAGQPAAGPIMGSTRVLTSGFWAGRRLRAPEPTATTGPGTPLPTQTSTPTQSSTPLPTPTAMATATRETAPAPSATATEAATEATPVPTWQTWLPWLGKAAEPGWAPPLQQQGALD